MAGSWPTTISARYPPGCRTASASSCSEEGSPACALFSNDERNVIHAQRPVILNGIEDFIRRGDLTDRTVFIHLAPIAPTKRRDEEEFWSSFRADYPRILGGVLDAVVGGIRMLPSVNLSEKPRMADYAKWGEAVGLGLGSAPDTFLSTYNTNRKQATLTVLEDSAVGDILLQIAPNVTKWGGTCTELLAWLTKLVGKKIATSARWPKTATKFSNELRRVAPQLYMHGLFIQFARTCDERLVVITKVEVPATPASGVSSNPAK